MLNHIRVFMKVRSTQGKKNLNNAKHPAFHGPLLNLKLDLQPEYGVLRSSIGTVSEEAAGNFSTKFLASSTGRPIERREAAPTVTIKVVLRSGMCSPYVLVVSPAGVGEMGRRFG